MKGTEMSSAGQTPLYVQIAQRIRTQIAGGEYPVGALLPTENELSLSLGVSRQTVRQAFQHLRHEGLLSAKKGVGTRVEAAQSASVYQYALQSLTDVLQYATETEFEIERSEKIVVAGQLASTLGCRPGREWIRLTGLRRAIGASEPLCMLEVLIDAHYSRAVKDLSVVRTPIFARIEQQYGETIAEIHQQMEGSLVGDQHAAALAVDPGSAALRVTRRFFATGRRLIEVSISLHPASRFSYAVTLKRRT
jgi:GntR family transcriptional regulator